MDYEKKYNEALERCKEWASGTWGHSVDDSPKDIAEFIFPQLAESEDERIRKWIYSLVENLGYPADEDAEKELEEMQPLALAYLEKQKEQKKSLSERFRQDFPTVADFIESVDDMEKNRAIEILEDYLKWAVSESEEECSYTWNELANAIRLGIDAMKEKKPNIELIQKSWYMEGYHDREYNKEPKWIIKTGEGGPKYEDNPKYGQLIKKKSSEWSEEDEGMLNCIIATLCEEEHGGRETNNKMVTWLDNRLKSLHPVKQEWSEEDEEHLKSIISTIEMCMMDCEDAKAVLGYYESDISWLKSLRPHWKPSEEQMKASTPVLGAVHHVLNCHYIETDSKQLSTRLRGFPEGAKVDIYFCARKEDNNE